MQALRRMKKFRRVISPQTFIVIGLAWAATALCLNYGLAVELPTNLIAIAIIFPVVFSINAAYRRREEALASFASLKANAVALYLAQRDWNGDEARARTDQMRDLVAELLEALSSTLASKAGFSQGLAEVFGPVSRMSRLIEQMRAAGATAADVSRANQYLRGIMVDVERMGHIRLYRTPSSLRGYSQVFLNLFPILYAPYFADLSLQYFGGLGYWLAALYGLVLVGLDNIQEDLENPFDRVGADDVDLAVAGQYRALLQEPEAG